jgi:hypothetical protein
MGHGKIVEGSGPVEEPNTHGGYMRLALRKAQQGPSRSLDKFVSGPFAEEIPTTERAS